LDNSTPARETRFTVVFYGLKFFDVKTAQFCETQCKPELAEHRAHATVRDPVKTRAKPLS